jgi:hypothetical protein
MPEQQKKGSRPVWLPWICSLLFAAGLLNIMYTFTGAYAPYGNFYPAAMALLTVVVFAGLSGIWSMEKWGVWVFSIALACILVVNLLAGAFQWYLLLLLVPACLFASVYGRMK